MKNMGFDYFVAYEQLNGATYNNVLFSHQKKINHLENRIKELEERLTELEKLAQPRFIVTYPSEIVEGESVKKYLSGK